MEKLYFHKKVMVVDDNSLDHMISRAVIENRSFAEEIVPFLNVAAALDYLRSLASSPDDVPSIIFLDVNMPDLDGFDFLEAYLQLPAQVQEAGIIIMISATNSLEELERIKTYDIVKMFFEKPLTFRVLDDINRWIQANG